MGNCFMAHRSILLRKSKNIRIELGEETMKTISNISLHIENHELDFRIPNQVTLVWLKILLDPILREK